MAPLATTKLPLHLLSFVLLASTLDGGCQQFKNLKASNSDERKQDDADDEEPYVPDDYDPPDYSSSGDGDGDGDGDYNYFPFPITPTPPTTQCSGTRMLCTSNSSWCVDVMTTTEHCGACGNACGSSQRCVAGVCSCYSEGLVICDGQCVAPAVGICGECGGACPAEPACEDDDSHLSDWPTLAGDMQRTGYNAGEQGTPPLTADWAISVIPAELNPAMIWGARALVTARGNDQSKSPVVALDLATGAQLWKTDMGEVAGVGQPTVSTCRVYMQSGGASSSTNRLWSLDVKSGDVIWGKSIGSQRKNYWSPTLKGDTLYVSAGYGDGLSGYSRIDATVKFEATTTLTSGEWSAAVSGDYVYTFIGGKLRRYDASVGTILDTIGVKTTTTTNTSTAPVFAEDGTAYLLSPPLVYAFEPLSKRLLWQAGTLAAGVPALAEGLLLVIDDGVLTARDPATGDLLWTAANTAGLLRAPVAAHGFAYAASADKTYAVDLKTGAVVWQADGGGWLSIGSGRLLVAGEDGILRSYVLTQPASP